MGIVYLACHLKLNRRVALKMVLGDVQAGRNEVIRFLAEAEAVAAIRHANVVQVIDYGESDGRPFMALEYLCGGSLAAKLEGDGATPIHPREAAALLAQISLGVAAAHALGIVHRDLKPANVLLDEHGVPKVADFGLAKRGTASNVTQTGQVMGTPAFMSPEQARGDAKFVGPPADVWAVGAILYNALTGSRPFTGTVQEILARAQNADPVPPRQAAPGIARDLELICLKCLEKHPHDRYPSAAEVADDLERFLRGEPISIRAPGFVERSLRWARRNRARAAAYAASIVGGLALLALLAVFLQKEDLNQAKQKSDEKQQQEEKERRAAEEREAQEAKRRADAERGLVAASVQAKNANYFSHLIRAAEFREIDPPRGDVFLSDAEVCPAEMREISWNLLRRFCHREHLTREKQDASTLATSPDSKRLAIGGAKSHTIRILELETGRELQSLTGHGGAVTSLRFVENGLVSGSQDGTVRVWILETNTAITTHAAGNPVEFVAADPRGRWIAACFGGPPSARGPHSIRVWIGGESKALAGHQAPVGRIVASADGSLLASCSSDGSIRIWDMPAGTQRSAIDHGGWITALAFAKDGKTLAAGNIDGMLGAYSINGEPVKKWSPNAAGVNALDLHPDGTMLASAHEGGLPGIRQIRLSDPRTGNPLFAFNCGGDVLRTVAFAPDGRTLAACETSGTLRTWRMAVAPESQVLSAHLVGFSVAFDPRGGKLASGGGLLGIAGEIREWDAGIGRTIGRAAGKVVCLAYDSTGRLASGAADGSTAIWDTAAGTERTRGPKHGGEVRAVAFSPDRSLVASAGMDRKARVWDAATGAMRFELNGHDAGVMGVAFVSPEEVATASFDKSIRFWDVKTGAPRRQFTTVEPVYCFVLSPDRKSVFTGERSAVRKYELETGRMLQAGPGHSLPIYAIAIAGHGRTLASGSNDGTVKLWDAEGLRDVVTLPFGNADPKPMLRGLAFSPDDQSLAGIAVDGKIRIWR
jgi:WD40 repeat protein